MRVAIIGTGNMARGVAARALAGGHHVSFVGTAAAKAEALADEMEGMGEVRGADTIDADIVVLAVPYTQAPHAVRQHAGELGGSVLVDVTNPVDASVLEPLDVSPFRSGAEAIADVAPDGAAVVKAFNTAFAGTLLAGSVAGQPLDILLAGDDDDAKALVTRLVRDGGQRAIDAGLLVRARELEALGYLHMAVQASLGTPLHRRRSSRPDRCQRAPACRSDSSMPWRCGGELDVGVVALRGPGLGGQHAAAVHVLEVAVGELVAALGLDPALVVDREVPAPVGGVAVRLDVRVLPGRGRLVLAPIVAVVEDHPALGDELLARFRSPVMQLDCRSDTPRMVTGRSSASHPLVRSSRSAGSRPASARSRKRRAAWRRRGDCCRCPARATATWAGRRMRSPRA